MFGGRLVGVLHAVAKLSLNGRQEFLRPKSVNGRSSEQWILQESFRRIHGDRQTTTDNSSVDKQRSRSLVAVHVIERLAAILDCPNKEAETIYHERSIKLTNPQLALLESLKSKYGSLGSVLRENIWILEMPASGQSQDLYSRLRYLVRSGISPGSLFVVEKGLECEKNTLTIERKVNERVDFFRDSLGGSERDVLQMFFKDPMLVRIDIKRLKLITKVLLENGIAPQYIRSDPWALHRNADSTLERLRIAHSVKLPNIKPWILRCTQSFFDCAIERQRETNDILGEHHNVSEYLAARLGISVAEVTGTMATRLPMLLHINAPKMKAMLNVLLEDLHLKPSDIQQFPFVLGYRVETVCERHSMLVAAGCWPVALRYLCKNGKHLEKLIVKMSRERLREESASAEPS